MVLTKKQIIEAALEESIIDIDSKFVKKIKNRMLKEPEIEFITKVKKELKWKLDPIRTNCYIVTV